MYELLYCFILYFLAFVIFFFMLFFFSPCIVAFVTSFCFVFVLFFSIFSCNNSSSFHLFALYIYIYIINTHINFIFSTASLLCYSSYFLSYFNLHLFLLQMIVFFLFFFTCSLSPFYT